MSERSPLPSWLIDLLSRRKKAEEKAAKPEPLPDYSYEFEKHLDVASTAHVHYYQALQRIFMQGEFPQVRMRKV